MVAKAKEEIEQEIVDKEEEKERYLAERAPTLQTGGMSFAELQVLPSIHTFSKPIDYIDLSTNSLQNSNFPNRSYVGSYMPRLTWWMRSDMTLKPKSCTTPERYSAYCTSLPLETYLLNVVHTVYPRHGRLQGLTLKTV
jgi:hypothetical protein